MKFIFLIVFATLINLPSFGTIGPIQGDSVLCTGWVSFFTDTTAGGIWSSSDTGTVVIDSNTGDYTAITAGIATITYTVGGSFVVKVVTVNQSPSPIFGQINLCPGTAVTLYDTTAGGGHWELDGTSVYVLIDGPDSVRITSWGTGPDYLSFIGTNSCRTSIGVFVYPPPPPIAGITSINAGSTTTLSNSWPGGIWSSSNPAVATVDSFSGIVSGISPGVTTIYYTRPCTTSVVVTVLPPVSIPITATVKNNEIHIFPNPAKSTLTIFSKDKISVITIANCLGQNIYNREYDSNEAQIDIAHLTPGIYFLKINGTEMRRFVKE